jgi:hypothetical protein
VSTFLGIEQGSGILCLPIPSEMEELMPDDDEMLILAVFCLVLVIKGETTRKCARKCARHGLSGSILGACKQPHPGAKPCKDAMPAHRNVAATGECNVWLEIRSKAMHQFPDRVGHARAMKTAFDGHKGEVGWMLGP